MATRSMSGMRFSMSPSYADSGSRVAARVRAQASQHSAIVPQRVISLWRFDNLNDSCQSRVPHDPAERLGPDSPLGDPLVTVHPRSAGSAGVIEMQALKQIEPDHAVELLPHRLDPRQVISDGVQMGRVEAKPNPRPDSVRQRVAQVAQLLEPRAQRRSRSRRSFDPHFHVAGNRLQTFRVARSVALETRVAVVHVVARVRDDRTQTQGLRALQLFSEALYAARAAYGVGRVQVGEVAAVRRH